MEFPDVTLFGALFGLFLQRKPDDAIIVRIVPPPSELATLSDVLIRSLGLSGVLAVLGVLFGLALGGAMFWVRRRSVN